MYRRSAWPPAQGLVLALAVLALVLAACGGAAPASTGSGTGTAAGAPSTAVSPGSAAPSTAGGSSLASPGAPSGTPLESPASPGASATASATPPRPSGTPPPRATVVMRDLAFSPTTLNIATGTTVVFTNEDTVGHMPALGTNGVAATNPFFAPIDLPAGASATVVFNAPGTYPITCLIHPDMNMTITVR